MQQKKYYINEKNGFGPFSFSGDDEQLHPIIFISFDMVPSEFYRSDGAVNRVVRTPNLDRLSEEGVRFTNCFASYTLCTPSRASYLTGRYTYITGNGERAHDGVTVELRENDIIFPQYLKSVGYHTRHIGKSHVGTATFTDVFTENDIPWDRWSPPWYDDEEYLAFLRRKGLSPYRFSRSVCGSPPDGKGKGNFYGGWITDDKGNPFPKEATYPFFLVEKALAVIDSRPAHSGPLYLQLDFFGPHQPFAIPGGMEEREKELREMVKPPPSFAAATAGDYDDSNEARVYRMYRKNWGMDDPAVMEDYMVCNALQFDLLDEALGKLFAGLEEKNLFDRSWIFCIADHGEMNGESALVDKGVYLHPKTLRVPFYVKPPADSSSDSSSNGTESRHDIPGFTRGSDISAPVALLDIAPTLYEICGIDTMDRLDGMSLLSLLQNGETAAGRPPEKPILFEAGSHVVPNPCVGMYICPDGENEYIFTYNMTDDHDELYHLNSPREYVNVIREKEYQQVLADILVRFDEVLSADPRWFGYSQCFQLEYARFLEAPEKDRQMFL
jgi:arylsulfatase A-like enzyme